MVERRTGAALLGLAALALGAVWLAPAARGDDAGPGTAVAARLSSVDGHVQISQGNQLLTDQAIANTPLFEGTQVTTSDDGRAEIQFDDGSVARISPSSSLVLTALSGQDGTVAAEIVLASGLGYFELQNSSVRIKFNDSEVTGSGFTVLRVDVDNPPGELAVFSGNAHLERGGNLTLDLHGGESVSLSGADASRYTLAESIEPNSWDAWNSDRDQALTADAAAKTGAANNLVNENNPAWNDLDANGTWYDVPGQGNIWSPFVASGGGWDPYGCGQWMWTPRFGYVWVSCESWGFMPYQCGAWNFYDGFGWGWNPGMMGGCRNRWGAGYRGLNIGNAPVGYRPIRRPGIRRPILAAGAHPPIAVNRGHLSGIGELPARDRNAPVEIAGNRVEPRHALVSRPGYNGPATGFVNHSMPAYTGQRTAGQPAANARPAYAPGRPVATPAPAYAPTRGYSPPPSRGSSSGSAPSGRAPSGGGSYSGGGYYGGGGGAPSGGGGHPSGGGGSGGGGGHH
jgi:hypothetical protein